MDLKTYLQSMTPIEREHFAKKCDTSTGHLTNIAGGYSSIHPRLCTAIERVTGGKVTRRELRADYAAIWPDLSKPSRAKAAQ